MYSFDRRNLPVELERLCEHMVGVEDDRAAEAEQLSRPIKDISDALVDLNVLPIHDIPSQPRSTKDVLTVFGLVLERLLEEHALPSPLYLFFFLLPACIQCTYISLHMLMF
jgi:hypothetical protein